MKTFLQLVKRIIIWSQCAREMCDTGLLYAWSLWFYNISLLSLDKYCHIYFLIKITSVLSDLPVYLDIIQCISPQHSVYTSIGMNHMAPWAQNMSSLVVGSLMWKVTIPSKCVAELKLHYVHIMNYVFSNQCNSLSHLIFFLLKCLYRNIKISLSLFF